MSEQAVEERRGWASDVVSVVLYSIVILPGHASVGTHSGLKSP